MLPESLPVNGGKQRLASTRLHGMLVAEGHRVGRMMLFFFVCGESDATCVASTTFAGRAADLIVAAQTEGVEIPKAAKREELVS